MGGTRLLRGFPTLLPNGDDIVGESGYLASGSAVGPCPLEAGGKLPEITHWETQNFAR